MAAGTPDARRWFRNNSSKSELLTHRQMPVLVVKSINFRFDWYSRLKAGSLTSLLRCNMHCFIIWMLALSRADRAALWLANAAIALQYASFYYLDARLVSVILSENISVSSDALRTRKTAIVRRCTNPLYFVYLEQGSELIW